METLYLIGQILLGVYFIVSGVTHFARLDMMAGYAHSKGVPQAKLMTMVTGLMLLLGGVGVLFQYQLEIAYTLLIVFLVTAAFKMHAFWAMTDPMAKMNEMVNFQKNLAIASALAMLLASM